MLKELLPKKHMQHVESVQSWEAAIRLASEPLLNSGYINELYIDHMIAAVEAHGPYIVLMDYFALPHAKPGEGVNKLGMSLLKLDTPVDLHGNQVSVFLVLAAIDANSHMKALMQISELLADEKKYRQMLFGDLSAIYNLL